MATARVGRVGRAHARVSARVPRVGRVPPARRGTSRLEARRTGPIIDTSKLSHVARRRIAQPPMAVVDRVGEAVHAAVLAWAQRFIDAVMRKVVPDIVQDATSEDIDAILAALDDPTVAKALLDQAFAAVDAASSDDLRVIGVQTSTVVSNAEDLQRKWIRESTDLIRATEDVRRRVERIVSDPVSQGRSVADIRELLEEQAGYAASRAELTARTVTLQTYGRIQEQRQRDAGFTQYVWTTSLDERVREDHAELDGTVQSWDDPPIIDSRTGRRGHPGSDFQCRCSAVPFANEDDLVEPIEPDVAPLEPARLDPPVATDGTVVDIRSVSHAELDADKIRPGVLEALRADPAFLSTGLPTSGAARNARSGFDHLNIRMRSPDGVGPLKGEGWYLIDGSHRLQVAREFGIEQLPAIVRDVDGNEIFRGLIPVLPESPKARAAQRAAALRRAKDSAARLKSR